MGPMRTISIDSNGYVDTHHCGGAAGGAFASTPSARGPPRRRDSWIWPVRMSRNKGGCWTTWPRLYPWTVQGPRRKSPRAFCISRPTTRVTSTASNLRLTAARRKFECRFRRQQGSWVSGIDCVIGSPDCRRSAAVLHASPVMCPSKPGIFFSQNISRSAGAGGHIPCGLTARNGPGIAMNYLLVAVVAAFNESRSCSASTGLRNSPRLLKIAAR